MRRRRDLSMLDAIESLLQERIGLHPLSVGSAAIERAVRVRMQRLAVREEAAYVALLQRSEQELRALIEEVVVPETWFFRNHVPFEALAEYATKYWYPRHPGGVMRILSLPCSTGEEPYSITITLLDTGIEPRRFSVQALDINGRALDIARRAMYRASSFRGTTLEWYGEYFIRTDGGFRVVDLARAGVSFAKTNLLDENFTLGHQPYDVIFCRNLLIYFHRSAQERAVRVLHSLLMDHGILFLGHAEMSPPINERFVRVGCSKAFASRKREVRDHPVADTAVLEHARSRHRGSPSRMATRRAGERATAAEQRRGLIAAQGRAKGLQPIHRLRLAEQRLAEGELEQAAQLCEAYLRDDAACAQAWYLLGTAREGQLDYAAAGQLYHRALQLEPNHYDALLKLSAEAERRGDNVSAALYMRRAQRAAARRAP